MSRAISVGTDCSGIDAPLFALDNLGISFIYKFASEVCKHARKSLLANHNPEVLYEDLTMPRVLPKLDLYIAGPPCQPFSAAGKKLGPKDERAIISYILDTIYKTDTEMFILENVKRLLSFKEYFSWIINSLTGLGYNIKYSVLNTKDYGIPQSRNRVYIIGTKCSSGINFKWPQTLPLKDHYISENESFHKFPRYLEERYETVKDTIFCNVNIQRIGSKLKSPGVCNTITRNGDVWCILKHRRATIDELLSLQGFPIDFIKVVSDSQLKKQIGNSMSVNVLEEILKELLPQ